MDTYKFSVGHNGNDLEGVVPGEILVDAVVLALRKVYPEAQLQSEEQLRSQIAEYMAKDAVVPRYPVILFQEEGGDNTVTASLTLSRLSGTVPPLQNPPPQLARPHVERPAEWEGLVHRQIYRYIRGQIEAGIYAVGDELPSPEQLEWHFGTSRSTSGRHAYSQLIAEGLVADHGNDRYVVSAMTPPPVQTVEAAVDRLDALEVSVHETLVALRSLRADLAGTQTPCCGQWWEVRSLALGADPAEVSQAVCTRDSDTGELQWLFGATLTTRQLHHFQPLRRLTYLSDWTCDKNHDKNTPDNTPSDQNPYAAQQTSQPTTTTAAGAAYYPTDDYNDTSTTPDY
ncbi:Uncharacterised protein [Mycolicibacterium vanbaalenii]|uniref:HTH gntR-type domain-containing protein n=1 Tax=Mycolicibacterium vanbaalenii TaxID=110539 RepID=A0A5S9R2H4_MYCVN|nr:winged helix-turn-helix domain-containing protein [Mycolicibacterium vanbaalenii]CAA0126545.1 Uncharacterised protein [Mycolicibacterium vanbaalenii]